MKVNDLKQLIRQMVKEEVASEVSKAMGKVLVEMVREIKNTPSTPVLEQIEEEEAVQAPVVLKTNNPKLNSVLAETARNFKPLPKTPDSPSLVDLMEGGFDKIGKGETIPSGQPQTKMDFLKQMVNESATQTPSVLDNTADVPDVLKKVFKKDFRSILALSKQKHGGYSPNVSMDG